MKQSCEENKKSWCQKGEILVSGCKNISEEILENLGILEPKRDNLGILETYVPPSYSNYNGYMQLIIQRCTLKSTFEFKRFTNKKNAQVSLQMCDSSVLRQPYLPKVEEGRKMKHM